MPQICLAYMPTSNHRGTDEHICAAWITYLLYIILAKNRSTLPYGKEKEKAAKEGTKFKFLPHQDASTIVAHGNRVEQVRPAVVVHARARHARPADDALRLQIEVTNHCFLKCAVTR